MATMKNSLMLIGTVEISNLKEGWFMLHVKEVKQKDLSIRCVVVNETLLASKRFLSLLDGDNIALEGALRSKEYLIDKSVGSVKSFYVEVHDVFQIPKPQTHESN